MDSEEDRLGFKVVVNHEEQYSLWPSERALPLGWVDAGYSGTKEECLAHIEQVWQDMRPRSVRERIASAQNSSL
jgi:MbtH protein